MARWLAISASARLDRHSEFGTFVSPRVSGLVRRGRWSSRAVVRHRLFAPTPLTEETEAAGLSLLTVDGPLKPERGRSASFDVTRASGPLSATLTLFHSTVDRSRGGGTRPTATSSGTWRRRRRTPGIEALAVWKTEDFSLVANYAYVRSRETAEEGRRRRAVDAASQRGSGRRLGMGGRRTARRRMVLHRHAAAGSEPVSHREPALQRVRRPRHASARPRRCCSSTART